MIRAGVLFLGLLVATSNSLAGERGFKLASVAFGAGVFADAWTSERAFDSGFGEKNPALPERPTDSRFVAQVIVVDGAVYLFARHLRHSHPVAARWVLIAGAVLHAKAAIRNDLIYDDWRRHR